MAEPTESVQWATNATALDIQEPTVAQRLKGIEFGASWTRKRTNYMFHAIGKWIAHFKAELALKAVLGEGSNETRKNSASDAKYQNASNLNAGTVPSTRLASATTEVKGAVEKATQPEMNSGIANKFPDALAIQAYVLSRTPSASTTAAGLVEKATQTEMNAGTSNKFPDATAVKTYADSLIVSATTTLKGVVEKATQAELVAGTADKYPDSADVKSYVEGAFVPQSLTRLAQESLGIFVGSISSNGTSSNVPAGWTVAKVGTGWYRITHNKNWDTSKLFLTATISTTTNAGLSIGASAGPNSMDVIVHDRGTPDIRTDAAFDFNLVAATG